MKIEELRNKIDQIDLELLRLFEERLSIVEKIRDYKIKNNLNFEDKLRESEMLNNNLKHIKNKENIPYYKDFFKDYISLSKRFMKNVEILNEKTEK